MKNIREHNEDDYSFSLKVDDAPNIGGPEFDLHIHDCYELYCFVEGDADYVVEGNVYPLKPGNILLMRPGEVHHLRVKSRVPYRRFVIWFTASYMEKTGLADILLTPFNRREPGKRNLYTEELFHSIKPTDCLWHLAKVSVPPAYEHAVFKSHMITILEAILEAYLTDASVSGSDLRVKGIIQYINTHIRENISLDALCEEAGLSRAQLDRLFRKEAHMSVGQYVNTKRMYYARSLLESGLRPSAVAAMCGYSDYSAFYRMYRQVLGVTPSETK